MTTPRNDRSTSSSELAWKTRLAVSVISAVSDHARRPDGTLNRRLLKVLDFKAPPTPHAPLRSILSSDVTVDPARNLWFRLFTPVDLSSSRLPVMVFFHGGGFSFLSAASKSYDVACRRFAKRLPAVVVSVDYRLTPEHKFPCQYEDGFDVLKFLDNNHSTILPPAADLSKCFISGDSAGANLAHHVAVRYCRSQTNFQILKLVGLISIQPFFGGQERTESETRLDRSFLVSVPRTDWAWKVFLPADSDRDHHAANVSGPNAEDITGLDGFPHALVFVGGLDPLQDRQRRYCEWLRKSGKEVNLVEYPNMIHAFYVFPELPESSQLFSQVAEFVAKRLSKL